MKMAQKMKKNYLKKNTPIFRVFFRFFRFPENHAIFREKFREKHARAKLSLSG
jgi:hypothetical protein